MIKKDLIKEISEKTGIEKLQVERIIESFTKEVKESLTNNEYVSLRGFGNFIVKRRAAKIARNIRKKVELSVPACNVPAFKPSKLFLRKVRQLKS